MQAAKRSVMLEKLALLRALEGAITRFEAKGDAEMVRQARAEAQALLARVNGVMRVGE